MSRVTSYAPGQFCWVDLMTPDAQAAFSVYAQQSLSLLRFGQTGMQPAQYDAMFMLMQAAAQNPFIG